MLNWKEIIPHPNSRETHLSPPCACPVRCYGTHANFDCALRRIFSKVTRLVGITF